ncbi:hypothetical protein KCM76_17810 [Zooshikella marina]|uniref:hypothetical protein n=1 Tax=Zooshikella ganghwensis TaxID=202772 RepID=UPI001BB039AE|nr:hypothetical protein [Zooshikella ganghwensis]MBU2707855.1 hypothetical protein [Zooshikella ganghwensis]
MKYSYPRLAIAVILVILLASCANTKKTIIKTEQPLENIPNIIIVNIEQMESVNVSLREQGYSSVHINQTMHQAQMNAAMQPGYTHTAGFTGAIIGGAIIRNMEENRAQQNKNRPVTKFLDTLGKKNQNILVENDSNSFLNWKNSTNFKAKRKSDYIHITPTIKLTSDYRALILTALVEIYNNSEKISYRNYFHLQSSPLLQPNETISNLETKTDSMKLATSEIKSLLKKLPDLINNDIKKWQHLPTKNQSIKFTNSLGRYYERGRLLANKQGHITYRSLRGEIKHFPFQKMVN